MHGVGINCSKDGKAKEEVQKGSEEAIKAQQGVWGRGMQDTGGTMKSACLPTAGQSTVFVASL